MISWKNMSQIILFLRRNRNFVLAYTIPLVLLLVFKWQPEKPKDWDDAHAFKPQSGAFIMMLMACYWVTECIPLTITSLLPVALVPLMGIESSEAVAVKYLSSTVFFVLGCCLMSLAFEFCYHIIIRIANWVVSSSATTIPIVLLRLMSVTMLLSMFCSNISTTTMMIPITKIIVNEFQKKTVPEDPNHPRYPAAVKKFHNLKTVFYIATAYSANIGGVGTPIGSSTNVVAEDLLDNFKQDALEGTLNKVKDPEQCYADADFPFTSWVAANILPMLINLLLTWLYLHFHFLTVPAWTRFWRRKSTAEMEFSEIENEAVSEVRKAIQRDNKELGPITFQEIVISVLFILLILLWIFREPNVFPGWADSSYRSGYLKDATATLLVCFILFVFPKKLEYYRNFFTGGFVHGIQDKLLTWEFTEENIPWSPFLLLGGGSAMALAAKASGLNAAIGTLLDSYDTIFNKEMTLATAMLITAVITSVASNSSTAIILIPVLLTLAQKRSIHPVYLVIGPTVSASYAFIFSVSTPSNTIAFIQGGLQQKDMILAGLPVTIICNVVQYACVHLITVPMIKYHEYDNHCGVVNPIKSIARMIQDQDLYNNDLI